MRAAVVATVMFALVVVGLLLVIVEDPVTVLGEPTPQAEVAATPAPTAQQTQDSAPCPQPGQGGPDLTGCPDGTSPATPLVGMGGLRRIESLPPQAYP